MRCAVPMRQTGSQQQCIQPASCALPFLQDSSVWEFDTADVDLPAALRLLAAEVGGARITPGVNCRGVFCTPSRPPLPAGEQPGACWSCQCARSLQTCQEHMLRINENNALQGASRQRQCAKSWQPCNRQVPPPQLERWGCAHRCLHAGAHLWACCPPCLPCTAFAGAVVVDESLTSGGSYFDAARGCPQFCHLTLTGALRCMPHTDPAMHKEPTSRCCPLQAVQSAQAYLWLWGQRSRAQTAASSTCKPTAARCIACRGFGPR